MPASRSHPLLSYLVLFACLLLPLDAAQAGLLYHLTRTEAAPGAPVALEGLLYNDTGNPLTTPVPPKIDGQWEDAQGHTTPAHFQLQTSPDAASLPANTFTQVVWTGTAPSHLSGLVTLHLSGTENTLLALRVSGSAPPIATESPQPVSAFDTFRNAISPYDPTYFAVGRNGGATARFQLSFKYRLFSPTNAQQPSFNDNWYLGYTQTSLWDLHSDSIPFIDTTYNPSLFWMRESLLQSHDKRWFLGLNTGIEHKSNGKAGDDSRSLNDLYVQPQFNYRSGEGSTLSFLPRFKYYVGTDSNMRYPDYLGHVDWKLRWAQDDGLVLSALYRQGTGSRNATQLEAAWPLKRTFLHMNGYVYAQYFRGYGETLLDYNQKYEPQFRIGIALVP
ncbi:MAG TPA: phospholipase A [Castellaniella sp.]|uniref:phospholipase A n=1 Tax=Castellaniella sp. TaxID=1955812 RepID=UPI002F0069E6